MEAMVRNQHDEILQNQLQKVLLGEKKPKNQNHNKPQQRRKMKMENNFQIAKKRLGEIRGIKKKLQCCCKTRKTNSRLYLELENRKHGGNYFD